MRQHAIYRHFSALYRPEPAVHQVIQVIQAGAARDSWSPEHRRCSQELGLFGADH